MKKGISYLFLLLTLSYLLFWFLEAEFATNNHMIAYLLAMIVTHFILERNEWLAELLYKQSEKSVPAESEQVPPLNVEEDNPKVTQFKKKDHNKVLRINDAVQTLHVGEKYDIHYNKNRYLIRQNKNGYFLTRESDGYTQVFKSLDDLFSKGKIENNLVKDVMNQIYSQEFDDIIVR